MELFANRTKTDSLGQFKTAIKDPFVWVIVISAIEMFYLLTYSDTQHHLVTTMKHPAPDQVKPSIKVLRHLDILMLSPESQNVQMSKITNDGLTQSGTGCFIAVTIWQQWASKG